MKRILLVAMLSCLGFNSAWAEQPVYFADPNLKAVVEETLAIPDPTPTDMLGLTSLNAADQGIKDITGLQYAKNLQSLWIRWNRIGGLSPLSGLINLQHLDAHGNRVISDVSPLSGLTNLRTLILRDNAIGSADLSGATKLENLHLEWNEVSNISGLAGLKNLRELYLQYNRVSDVSALSGLTSLKHLNLEGNPLSKQACTVYIPQIIANNPGIDISYDSCGPRRVVISATCGGSVISPGEGEFIYDNGEIIRLEAKADPYFIFVGFSGGYAARSNPTLVPVTGDYDIRANFQSILDVLHVDDNGSGDPGPGDPALSDPNENGTPEHPFDRIQEAIEVAGQNVSIIVHPGIYRENLDLLGKSLHLMGIDPNGPNEGPAVIIEGTGDGPVVRFAGSNLTSAFTDVVTANDVLSGTFTGFVILQGRGRSAGAIFCDSSNPTIAQCLIVGNRSTNVDGAAIYCTNSQAVLTNCTIADNCGGPQGAALVLLDSDVTITNSILWGNSPREILTKGKSDPLVRYCDVQGWWPDLGDLNADPLFARRGSWVNASNPQELLPPGDNQAVWLAGDYHLQSQAGRWDADGHTWVQDAASSPCIDGGDPSSPVGAEPAPNGGTINLGAYGGTTEASKTYKGNISGQ
jgi:Leucine-rich repeat (LRR) protein